MRSLLRFAFLFLCLASLVAIQCVHAEEAAAAATPSTPTPSPSTPSSLPDEAELEVVDTPDEVVAAAAAEPDSPDKPKSKNSEPISLTRPDFCRACYSVVEEFHKWTVRNFNDPNSRRNTTMGRGELVEWFCRTGAFSQFKQPLVYGCIKTIQDHNDVVLTPFVGTHTSNEYTTLGAVYKHKIAACAQIDACDLPPPEPRAKTDCEACDRLVKDLHWSLDREQKVNKTIVEQTLRTICMEVGMRHEKPMEIEAFCHEYVDEHWIDVQKMLLKIYNDPNVFPYQRQQTIKKRFCGGMTEVCDAERKEMEEEIRNKKEEEKKQRMAAREARKVGASKASKQAAEAARREKETVKDEL